MDGVGVRRWGMTALFVLFTVMGVALVVAGGGSDRIVGAASIGLFGLGGFAYLSSQRRRPEVALRVADIRHQGVPHRGVIAPARLAKVLPMTLGAVGMGVGTLLLGVFAEHLADTGGAVLGLRVLGFGGGGFFLFIGVAGIAGLRSGPPMLALLPHGVLMTAGLGSSFVAWSDVTDVGVYELQLQGGAQRFAGVRARDPERVVVPGWLRWLGRMNRRMSAWDVTYPESLFDLDAQQLAALLEAFADAPELRHAGASLPPGTYSYQRLRTELGLSPP